MQIGPYRLSSRVLLAPMAGITDRPFRRLCRRFGAGLAVSEMVSSNPNLDQTRKTRLKACLEGDPEPRVVQLVGAEPAQLAEAARVNVARGAQVIDINLGCPAKKVCGLAAGSALLKDEGLVTRILNSVVTAVDVPVTVKMRTGWDSTRRNAVTIARIAEDAGVQALVVHGRTRACGFAGQAEYSTIRCVKQGVTIPVIANGDIDSPEKTLAVLAMTGADGVMIGRAALGRPWIFSQFSAFLEHGRRRANSPPQDIRDLILGHLEELYAFYGEPTGVRIARKHLRWYGRALGWEHPDAFDAINREENARHQMDIVGSLLDYALEFAA